MVWYSRTLYTGPVLCQRVCHWPSIQPLLGQYHVLHDKSGVKDYVLPMLVLMLGQRRRRFANIKTTLDVIFYLEWISSHVKLSSRDLLGCVAFWVTWRKCGSTIRDVAWADTPRAVIGWISALSYLCCKKWREGACGTLESINQSFVWLQNGGGGGESMA